MKNNCGKTKEEIINEIKKMDKDFNPTHKQKGLTEFIELSRVSAQNINADYTKAINDEPDIFFLRFLQPFLKKSNILDILIP